MGHVGLRDKSDLTMQILVFCLERDTTNPRSTSLNSRLQLKAGYVTGAGTLAYLGSDHAAFAVAPACCL